MLRLGRTDADDSTSCPEDRQAQCSRPGRNLFGEDDRCRRPHRADAYEAIEGETLTAITAESWVDSRNLPRRMRMVMPMPGDPGEPTMTIDMQIDIRDYGIRPKIKLPNPTTVVEASSLAPEVDSVQS